MRAVTVFNSFSVLKKYRVMNCSCIIQLFILIEQFLCQLSESLLNMFDPTLENSLNESLLDEKLIPVYQKPKMFNAQLPGNHKIVFIITPIYCNIIHSLFTRRHLSEFKAEIFIKTIFYSFLIMFI